MKYFTRLGQKGFAHHFLIALLIVGSVSAFGAYRVIYSKADTNAYTFRKPNGCFPGKVVKDGSCHLYSDVTKISADCSQYHLQFSNGSCEEHCIGGWFVSATTGDCQQVQNPSGGGGAGDGGGGGGSNDKTKADCDNLNREFNTSNKQCGDCKNGYHNADGTDHGVCQPRQSTAGDTTTSGGASGGGQGGGHDDRTGPKVPPVVTDNAAPALCNAEHKKWHTAKSICGPECLTSFQAATEGLCMYSTTGSVADAPSCADVSTPDGGCVKAKNIDRYCSSRHLKLTDNKKNCKLDCMKGYTLNSTTCIEKGTDATSALANPAVLDLDTAMDKDTCAALGREWDNHAVLDDGSFGKGCATNKCDKKGVALVTQTDGAPYCKGYLTKNDHDKCVDQLHRKWVSESNGCRQNPKAKEAGARVPNAAECDKQHSTYVFKASADECLSAATAEKLASIAKSTGKPFIALSHMTAAQLCNVQAHKHWNGSKCLQDKPAQSVTGGVKTPSKDPGGNIPKAPKAPSGGSWESYCASLRRNVAGHCEDACKYPKTDMFYGTDSHDYRKCVSKYSVCKRDHGLKDCAPPPASVPAPACPHQDASCAGSTGNTTTTPTQNITYETKLCKDYNTLVNPDISCAGLRPGETQCTKYDGDRPTIVAAKLSAYSAPINYKRYNTHYCS